MKLSRILLQGRDWVSLPILSASPSDLLILKSADGLGPSEVDVLISEAGYFQGRRPRNKEITLRVGLNSNYTAGSLPSDLRKTLYGLLTPAFNGSIEVILVDENHAEWARITGYVKTIDPVIFAKEPEVQIVISGMSPYFRSTTQLALSDSSKSNPKFNNPGTAPSGFHMQVSFTAPVGSFTLAAGNGERMNVVYPFQAGDRLAIDTRPGLLNVDLVGQRTLVGFLDSWSPWLTLHNGVNAFLTNTQSFEWFAVYYYPNYWGV